MAIELISVAFFFMLGWLCLRIFGPAIGYAFIASVSLPIGIAAWVVSCLMLIAVRVPFNPVAGALLAVTIAVSCNLRWGNRPERREWACHIIAIVLIVASAAVLAYFEWTVFNPDMHWTLYMSDNLIDHGFIDDAMRRTQLGADPMYLPILSTIPRWFGGTYFVSFSPLMIICTAALFAVLGIRVGKTSDNQSSPLRFWLPILGAVALVSSGFYAINALQTKTHVAYALHMLAASGALYFASRERSTAWFTVALMFIAPMVVCRLEAGVAALPFLIVALAIQHIPLKIRLLGVAAVALAWGFSYFYLIGSIIYLDGTFDRGFVSKRLLFMGMLSAALGSGLLLAAMANRLGILTVWIERLASWLPGLMIGTLVTLLTAHAVIWPETFFRSIHGIFSTFASPRMHGTGYGFLTLTLLPLSLILRPLIPSAWTVMVPTMSYLAMLILIDFHLEGFPHWGPTGAITRIISHVLPVLLFYAVLRLNAPPAGSTAVTARAAS